MSLIKPKAKIWNFLPFRGFQRHNGHRLGFYMKARGLSKMEKSCPLSNFIQKITFFKFQSQIYRLYTWDCLLQGKPARPFCFRGLFKRDLRGRAAPTFKHTHSSSKTTFPFIFLCLSAKKILFLEFWLEKMSKIYFFS